MIRFDEFYSTVSIMDDYDGLLKLVTMLQKRKLWCGHSRTVESWRKILIKSL